MIRVTYSIPKALKEAMDKFPDVNWPEVFRQGLQRKLEKLEDLEQRGLL